jgi:NAD(P)-dependent dehydrogenase (short-subunit alcohol dehydrogenase family)
VNSIEKLARRYPQKRVLITGATSGLGEALALRFAGEGFRIGVAGRNPQKIARTVEKVETAGGSALAVQLEVTRAEEFEAAANQVAQAWGSVDIVINNAGLAAAGSVYEFGLDAWQDVLNTDLWSVIHGCRQFAPLMASTGGGHLVNVASAAGLLCAPEMAGYNVAKAGVVALSETLRVELAPDHIDVTVCCPTVFKSGLLDDVTQNDDHMFGRTADGLRDSMKSASIGSEDVADALIKTMARRKLYSVPMRDARTMWRLARYLPESYRNLLLYLYRRKLWIFNPDHH